MFRKLGKDVTVPFLWNEYMNPAKSSSYVAQYAGQCDVKRRFFRVPAEYSGFRIYKPEPVVPVAMILEVYLRASLFLKITVQACFRLKPD